MLAVEGSGVLNPSRLLRALGQLLTFLPQTPDYSIALRSGRSCLFALLYLSTFHYCSLTKHTWPSATARRWTSLAHIGAANSPVVTLLPELKLLFEGTGAKLAGSIKTLTFFSTSKQRDHWMYQESGGLRLLSLVGFLRNVKCLTEGRVIVHVFGPLDAN